MDARTSEQQINDLVKKFNAIRDAPASSKRTLDSDACAEEIINALKNLDMFVEKKIIENLENSLTSSQGDKALGLLYIQQIALDLPVSDSLWSKLLLLLTENPPFIQHLTRDSVGRIINAGNLSLEQIEQFMQLIPTFLGL